MHLTAVVVATIWMTILLAAMVVFATRATSNAIRILAVDALTLILVSLLVLYSVGSRQPYFMDAAMALALVSFIGTVAAARRMALGRVL